MAHFLEAVQKREQKPEKQKGEKHHLEEKPLKSKRMMKVLNASSRKELSGKLDRILGSIGKMEPVTGLWVPCHTVVEYRGWGKHQRGRS